MAESEMEFPQLADDGGIGRPRCGCGGCGRGEPEDTTRSNGENAERPQRTTGVRFGYIRFIGEFTHSPETKFTSGARVVVQSQRGIEIGEQVPLTCSGCDRSISLDQIKNWVDQSGEDTYIFNAGRILREATAADLAEYAHIQSTCREKRDFAQVVADRYKLPLKVAECECTFGGERVIFYFTAAERVDFRSMVKDLAKEYRTRIEMRQIGARDEARLLADFETCGREVCCKVFLKTLKPISMRMAKLQKATLDPSQVSGRCGRLKCCLRFEHLGYEELDKKLPRNGVRIRTEDGEGVIVNRQVLTQLVQIRTDAGAMMAIVAEDILETNVPPPEARPDAKEEGKVAPTEPAADKGRRPSAGARPTRRGGRQQPANGSQTPSPPGSDQPRAPRGQSSPATPPPSSTAGEQAEKNDAAGQGARRRRGKRGRRRRRPGGQDGNQRPSEGQ